jgi:RNA polymerase-binding protein DksA
VAKKSVKKAAVAASKKPAKREAKPAVKATAKAKSAAPAKRVVSGKNSARGAVLTAAKSRPLDSKSNGAAKPINGSKQAVAAKPLVNAKPSLNTKPIVNGKPVVAAPARLEKSVKPASPEKSNAIKSNAKSAAPVAKTPEKVEPPKPTGRPMLLQGPIAVRPMGKKATLPVTPSKPAEKPVKRKPLPTGEPAFVIVQPPTKAVATSEKAAKNKAGFSQKDLDFFRDLLLAKRRELVGDMSSMEREALRENSTDLSSLPVHMADQGTDAYEQEFTLHLVEKDRTLLRELNDALAKIQNGTYGICEGTGLPISKPRLEAQPWARHSIEHARALEKRQGMFRR